MEEPSSKAPPAASKEMTASRLRNLANKISTTKSHLDFLSTCNREQLVPKGFHLKWSSHYAEQGITSGIINRASLDLVRECHRLASKKLAALSREFNMGWSQLASALAPEALYQLQTQLSRDERRIGARLQRTKQGKLDNLRSMQRVREQDARPDEYMYFTRGKGDRGGDLEESVPSAARAPLSREPAVVGADLEAQVDGTCGAGPPDSGAILGAEREAGHPDAGDDLESACGAGHSGMDKVPRPVVTSEGTGMVTDSRMMTEVMIRLDTVRALLLMICRGGLGRGRVVLENLILET